ncbi:MAG: cupin domain-containing protein [Dehalobacterium sp.]
MTKENFGYLSDVQEELRSGGRHSFACILPKTMGSKGFSMGYHIMEPGGTNKNPDGSCHVHEVEQEAMFFIEGEGIATIGDKEYAIKDGSFMLAPVGIPHSVSNTSKDKLLKFIWVYSPPTPSQY